MQKIKIGINKAVRWLGKVFCNHWKSLIYYGCVAIVLGTLAYAAEVYRTDHSFEEMILPAAELAAKPAEKTPALIRLDGMEMIRGFSKEAVWNSELRQWENHEAVDYRLRGNEVRALADGRVLAVDEAFIEIDHGDLILRYGSVCPKEALKPNDKVKAGESIAAADDGFPAEAYMGAHLHLEAIYNEEFADAEGFIADAAQPDS